VVVKVKEQSQHQATFGIGYSANTGGRVSLSTDDRQVFGLPWDRATTTLNYGVRAEIDRQRADRLSRREPVAQPRRGQLRAAEGGGRESATAGRPAGGRSKDTNRFERLYYLEARMPR
jgi:translocation and assembly module TamA